MSKESFYIDIFQEVDMKNLAAQIAQQLEPDNVISFFARMDAICRSDYGDDYTELFDEWLNERFIRDNQEEEKQTVFQKNKAVRQFLELRKLSYVATVQGNGNLLIGKAYTAMLNLKPGDQFEIKLGRKQIHLIPSSSSKEIV